MEARKPEGSSIMDLPAGEEACRRRAIWNIPNQLTMARLVLSVVFFVLLALQNHGKTFGTFETHKINLVLNLSLAVFILAVITDLLDGYLARKWGLVSTFGRIADPFADKIVVCGGFIMLTGVTAPREGEVANYILGNHVIVEPWFAVVVVFREFLVSGLRSFLESRGVAFGAVWSGKAKMVIQSITIPLVIFYEANIAWVSEPTQKGWIAVTVYRLTIVFLVLTLVATLGSAVGYVRRAIQLIRAERQEN